MVDPNKQAQIHTRVRNAVTLVWGSLRLAPIIISTPIVTTVHYISLLTLWYRKSDPKEVEGLLCSQEIHPVLEFHRLLLLPSPFCIYLAEWYSPTRCKVINLVLGNLLAILKCTPIKVMGCYINSNNTLTPG